MLANCRTYARPDGLNQHDIPSLPITTQHRKLRDKHAQSSTPIRREDS